MKADNRIWYFFKMTGKRESRAAPGFCRHFSASLSEKAAEKNNLAMDEGDKIVYDVW